MAVYYNDSDPAACAWLRDLIAAGHLPAGEVDERSILDVDPSPRLQVSLPGEAVLVDGEPRSVPMQRFRLLIMLIDAWEKGLPLRGGMIEEAFSGRSAADLVRELRSDLAKGSVDSRAIHGWVQTVRSPAAYRLALARTEIEVIR